MRKTPLVSFSWNEGRIWDHWMVVHFLSGTIVACCLHLLEMHILHGYLVALGLMVSWEIGEMVGGVREKLENWLLDIVVGMAGFVLFERYIVPALGREATWVALFALFVLGVAGAFFGWRAYKKRRA